MKILQLYVIMKITIDTFICKHFQMYKLIKHTTFSKFYSGPHVQNIYCIDLKSQQNTIVIYVYAQSIV